MILEVFNVYDGKGGEEVIADAILETISTNENVLSYRLYSSDWKRSGAPSKLKQISNFFYNRDSAKELRNKIETFSPQFLLFHNIYPIGSPSLYKAALDTGVPVIQFIHNFRPFSLGGTLWDGSRVAEESLKGNYLSEIISGSWQGSIVKSFLFAMLLKKLHYQGWLESVHHWIAISDFMRDKFLEAGISSDKITTLRHSWNTMDKVPAREDKGYYLFLSRLISEKGVTVLLNAWELLENSLGSDTPQLIIGGSGKLEQDVRRAAELSEYITYAGFVDKDVKHELIQECRSMLAPSIWWEPLGLVTYEAYDFGKPMLAAASGGLTETIIDGVTGYLFEPGSPEALIETILKVEAMSLEERIIMGDCGRKWLLENADPEKWKKSFQAILDKVSKENSGR